MRVYLQTERILSNFLERSLRGTLVHLITWHYELLSFFLFSSRLIIVNAIFNEKLYYVRHIHSLLLLWIKRVLEIGMRVAIYQIRKTRDSRRMREGERQMKIFVRFAGAYNLLQLDLSANFLQEFPSDALRHLQALKFLNVSNNLITVSLSL